MAAIRFSAQPGGVEVAVGEAEIVVSFPDADSYDDLAQPQTVRVDLDSATARHLARELLAVTPTGSGVDDPLPCWSVTTMYCWPRTSCVPAPNATGPWPRDACRSYQTTGE